MKSFHEIQDIPVKFEATRSNVMIMKIYKRFCLVPLLLCIANIMSWSLASTNSDLWTLSGYYELTIQLNKYEQVNEKECKAFL